MRLLIITAAIVSSFMAVTMVFFQVRQKRYSGLGHWTAGTIAIALGHLAIALRGLIPDFPSIIAANIAYPLGTVLYLDGMRRFLNLSALSPAWYALPAVCAAICSYLYFGQDDTALRALTVSVVMAIPHLATAILVFRHMRKERLLFYPIIAVEICLASALIVARGIWVMTLPNFVLLLESPIQHGFFITTTVMQIMVTLSFIMLNSERLEKELLAADEDSKARVEQLEKAMAEVKTLSGLLPICASCKRICDDKGSWHQIEEYISDRSEADFSHGICPECAKKLYPEYWERKQKGNP